MTSTTQDPFNGFPDDSRVWVFALNENLDVSEREKLASGLREFLDSWKSHGAQVTGSAAIVADRFVVIGADSSKSDTSGCSIDSLFREVSRAASSIGKDILSAKFVFFREGETVSAVTREEFQTLAQSHKVDQATPVFDLTLTTLKEYRAGLLERAAKDSWHKRAFFEN